MNIVQCWSCGCRLRVAADRRDRRRKEAGENTIDRRKRVCVKCWSKIKRCNVARIKHLPSVEAS